MLLCSENLVTKWQAAAALLFFGDGCSLIHALSKSFIHATDVERPAPTTNTLQVKIYNNPTDVHISPVHNTQIRFPNDSYCNY